MQQLQTATSTLGKPEWRAMLRYVADLHARSTHPPRAPFPHPWEEIGPGYCYGPAFGHWDIVHAILDVMAFEPAHAVNQILNNLAAQAPDGLIPGVIWMRETTPRWSNEVGHPPLWPVAVQDDADQTGSTALIAHCFEPLVRQIRWFEAQRKAEGAGFFYTDILSHRWESGIDEGIRFHETQPGPYACVDATAHVYALYEFAAIWAERIGVAGDEFRASAAALREFIQNELFDTQTGFFHDIWARHDPALRRLAFEGMWPLVVGAATPDQAARVIDENLLNPDRFFTLHPIATVALTEPLFERRMWRGPTWNSMTYWAARGCLRYDRPDAAVQLLERALDASAIQFARTATIWEFYDPQGGNPETLHRKPHTPFNAPCQDYLGHNPLIAMARLYDQARR